MKTVTPPSTFTVTVPATLLLISKSGGGVLVAERVGCPAADTAAANTSDAISDAVHEGGGIVIMTRCVAFRFHHIKIVWCGIREPLNIRATARSTGDFPLVIGAR